ncbi:MAG: hypothetical protein CVV27_14720, partial [Candidatus Melainabacteria bacterium HGW-Melainabacteria-1]
SGISGKNIQVRRVKDSVTPKQLEDSIKANGLSEIVVQTDKGRYLISGDSLQIKGQTGLPKKGQEVDYGSVVGKVLFQDDEQSSRRLKNEFWIRAICEPTPAEAQNQSRAQARAKEIEAQARAAQAAGSRDGDIAKAMSISEANTATASIYGEQPALADVQEWCASNPLLLESPKLKRVCDYNRDSAVSPEELHKAVQRKAVVLNGIDSMHFPGERKPVAVETAGPPPAALPTSDGKKSAQETYYHHKNVEKAAEGATILGGGLLRIINRVLR